MKKKYQYVRLTETYNGKRYEGVGKTKTEARKKLDAKLKDAMSGMNAVGADMLFSAWADVCLQTYMKPRVRKPGDPKLRGTMTEATYNEYEQLCRNYIAPAIGNLRLREVSPSHIQAMLNNNAGMSFSHVSKLSITVKKICRYAVIDRLIPFDPSAGAVLPASTKGKRRSLTDAEKETFFRAAQKNPHGLLFRFLLATGMRPNELAAVTVGDISIDDSIVHIRHAVETGSTVVSTPKTSSGIRFTVINTRDDRTIIDDLTAYIQGRSSGFLFTKKDGGMLTRQALKRYWQSFCRQWSEEMGGKLSPDIVTYSLRHTFGTDMQRASVPIETTKFLMGHADIATTANIYVDQGKTDALRAVDILQNAK